MNTDLPERPGYMENERTKERKKERKKERGFIPAAREESLAAPSLEVSPFGRLLLLPWPSALDPSIARSS